MKPDFKQMSRPDLKKYVLSHPADDEALRELVLNRRNPNAKVFPPEFNNFHEVIKNIFNAKSSQVNQKEITEHPLDEN